MSAGPETAEQPAVVVAGDAMVDLTPTRTADGAAAFQPLPGGSCLNVAAGLGRLGVPTALLARLSDDHFGDLLRAHLTASGTRLTHVLPTSDPTTLAAVHLREDGSAAYTREVPPTAACGPNTSRPCRTAAPCLRARHCTEPVTPSPPRRWPICTAPAGSAAKASTVSTEARSPGCSRTPWRSRPTPAPARAPSRRTEATACRLRRSSDAVAPCC
ncbi:PfkB family carbohydrate kinase [Streptomyces sp. NPDC002920]